MRWCVYVSVFSSAQYCSGYQLWGELLERPAVKGVDSERLEVCEG